MAQIKVEQPDGGDPVRTFRVVDDDGVSLWYRSLGRNKKSCAINMRAPEGQQLVRQLAAKCDVIVENFRPGVMEKWGLGPEVLRADNESLIYTRVSGYGQTGPYARRPGFASAMGGLRYVNGFPGETPVRANLSIGDTLAGIHAALGILLALYSRQKAQIASGDGKGQIVDVSIYESVFNLMEGLVPEFDRTGLVREPSGTSVTGIAPTNVYRCADGKQVIVSANMDSIYKRLMTEMGREDLMTAEYGTNQGRVRHEKQIDEAVGAWVGARTADQVLERLNAISVPCSGIYSAREIMSDPHYAAREMIEQVDVNGRTLKIPAIPPKLSETPGHTDWAGPDLGTHTREVLRDLLGIRDDAKLRQLADAGVIGLAKSQ
ncbi:L-carnitine dehydratase/bile acid-inducible protein F [Thamnocephalis sphaerospora]|uniref:L-carnitine dehydratase/bile acid-inducible protein F n=1 Tax=Thamnocephalis sphaerospora TaxID=78915 RepID=A0A4P9XH96_9FUNG|nr:L-carnitine dehydratase/bile acid-inducible protein F [Thamnocephalis sphaerospora]RKP05625.1 L-carnitine dehydratase/bile acid-inducible protein F [Thamnocephalis sphaerospora]|eukprot:RKP05034.1 L-carnitine dehydratase/bile acid-inducible protein F [Thamnocephalis sphaerospora]